MNQKETSTRQIELRAYSKKELAGMYKISGKSLKTWLVPFEKEIGPRIGRFYSPRQMKIIFDKLGVPELICV